MTVRRMLIASAAAVLLVASVLPGVAQPVPKPAAPAAPAAAPAAAGAPAASFDATRLKAIATADLERIPSGCSFSAMRGKDLVAISIDDNPSADKTVVRSFWFKLDGKLVEAKGKSVRTKPNDQNLGVWTGQVGGQELRIVEGKGSAGTIEWGAPGAGGKLAIKWEAGC